ncbi:hypothetical protein J6590_018007 [Homalodisca vitripennis]|nr:hypothetical protein J6590_099258 [Homalodisca vitripennis]KAG8327568.1 hypothetical protein J6590_018007 [Homalodisca vitripennis]
MSSIQMKLKEALYIINTLKSEKVCKVCIGVIWGTHSQIVLGPDNTMWLLCSVSFTRASTSGCVPVPLSFVVVISS